MIIVFSLSHNFSLTLTMLTPTTTIHPQPPSGGTIFLFSLNIIFWILNLQEAHSSYQLAFHYIMNQQNTILIIILRYLNFSIILFLFETHFAKCLASGRRDCSNEQNRDRMMKFWREFCYLNWILSILIWSSYERVLSISNSNMIVLELSE